MPKKVLQITEGGNADRKEFLAALVDCAVTTERITVTTEAGETYEDYALCRGDDKPHKMPSLPKGN